jgi:hypothetical protein
LPRRRRRFFGVFLAVSRHGRMEQPRSRPESNWRVPGTSSVASRSVDRGASHVRKSGGKIWNAKTPPPRDLEPERSRSAGAELCPCAALRARRARTAIAYRPSTANVVIGRLSCRRQRPASRRSALTWDSTSSSSAPALTGTTSPPPGQTIAGSDAVHGGHPCPVTVIGPCRRGGARVSSALGNPM